MLLSHLPRESAYIQAVSGERGRWGDTEHLLAGIIDLLRSGNYLTQRAHFKGDPPPPRPFRRPGDPPEPGQRLGDRSFTRAQMRKILDEWRAGKPKPAGG